MGGEGGASEEGAHRAQRTGAGGRGVASVTPGGKAAEDALLRLPLRLNPRKSCSCTGLACCFRFQEKKSLLQKKGKGSTISETNVIDLNPAGHLNFAISSDIYLPLDSGTNRADDNSTSVVPSFVPSVTPNIPGRQVGCSFNFAHEDTDVEEVCFG